MARQIDDEVAYYYDFHPTEEDLMGETRIHAALVHYLVEVFSWLFHGQVCAICDNLNFYQTPDKNEKPLTPDVAVIKGVELQDVSSCRVGTTAPAPQVVFEIASAETWHKDLDEKPSKYAVMGVQEYFAYDPNMPPLTRSRFHRLFGWQLDNMRTMQVMPLGPHGALWSAQLDSWLVPDSRYLRLYDKHGQMRLTGHEAEAEARRALIEKLRSLGIDPDKL